MISFVYFDLGGVVEKDFSASAKWDELREELGISPSEDYEQFWKDYEREICTTRDVETLLPILKEKFSAKIPDTYSLLHAFVRRFEKNEPIWPVLSEIQKTTRIGLLTMMYPRMLQEIQKSGILPKIQWDVIVDSSEVGFVKMDKEFYETAQQRAGILPEEILFIDNTKKYMDFAKELGWQTFFYDSHDYEQSSKNLLQFWKNIQTV